MAVPVCPGETHVIPASTAEGTDRILVAVLGLKGLHCAALINPWGAHPPAGTRRTKAPARQEGAGRHMDTTRAHDAEHLNGKRIERLVDPTAQP